MQGGHGGDVHVHGVVQVAHEGAEPPRSFITSQLKPLAEICERRIIFRNNSDGKIGSDKKMSLQQTDILKIFAWDKSGGLKWLEILWVLIFLISRGMH